MTRRRQRIADAINRAAIPFVVIAIVTALYLFGLMTREIMSDAAARTRSVDSACGGEP